MVEIEDSVPEFQYLEDSEKVVCTLCSTLFGYKKEGEGGKKISTQLASLKNRLKIHLDSNCHKAALAKLDEEENMNKKMENRNTVVGMNLARTTFYLLSNGLPSSHYPTLLSLHNRNGCDVGELNHSHNFVEKMAVAFADVIQGRVKTHLNSRLVQTGCLPPCKLVEDGATYKHNTHHLIGPVTLFPGDSPLLQAVFLGAPKGLR